jgi:hypothetical protein
MGLDISHDAYSGSYCTFNDLRHWIAKQINIPLSFMEYYYDDKTYQNLKEYNGENHYRVKLSIDSLPIKWSSLKYNPLNVLLKHSDCDGTISYLNCGKIVIELDKIIENLSTIEKDNYKFYYDLLIQLRNGLNEAYINKETLKFC